RLAQWARLLTPGRQGLRAGAWYSVVSRTPKEVQLTVRGRTVTIARSLVELRDTPPSDWTVVHPANARESYMVCPGCRHRAQLPESRYGRCLRAQIVSRALGPGAGGQRRERRVAPRQSRAQPRRAAHHRFRDEIAREPLVEIAPAPARVIHEPLVGERPQREHRQPG